MVDIDAITTNLAKDAAGIWVARERSYISYPSEGNECCYAVEDSSFWFGHRNNVISHFVGVLSPGEAFFDIGGGNGCVASALNRVGVDAILVEPGRTGRETRSVVVSAP